MAVRSRRLRQHESALPRSGVAGLSALAVAAGLVGVTGALAPARAAAPPGTLAVDPITTVADGGTAGVVVRLTRKAEKPVTVRWSTTTSGTATSGRDFQPASGSVVFPAGTAAGTTRTLSVATRRTPGGEAAETIGLSLRPSGATLTSAGQPRVVVNAHDLPYLDRRLPVAKRVKDLLSRMTIQEKVGQMTQAERASVDANRSLITTWNLGSLLSGGGSTPAQNTPQAWADMVDAYQSYALATRLQIPMIYGVDSVHGHGNLYGATLIPHNVGLGATRDPALVAAAEKMVATETRATGIPWVFAPCLCVARDDRWGRTYESFGEDPSLVVAMETSIAGFQGTRTSQLADPTRVLATAKHFAGDGDTTYGSGRTAAGANSSDYPIDQGITQTSRRAFAKVDLSPYVAAVRTYRVGSIMPSYSSVDYTDDGLGNPVKMHANRELLQTWLKDKQGFDGFVISDYHGLDQIPLPTKAQKVTAWVNAGGDMAMEPDDYQDFETTLLGEVAAGRVSMARVNDAVSRILTKKFQLGLFEKPYADRRYTDQVGSDRNRAVARKAAAESQVLLKNAGGVLPLSPRAKVYVAGRNADDLGNQAGGWTITWQGGSGTRTKGTTILQGMRQVAPKAQITYSADASAPTAGSDVGVVVVGETPYSEGFGDVGGPQWAYDPSDNGIPREPKTMELKPGDRAVVDKVCTELPKCVVLIVSGRPQVLSDQLGRIDGLVASWLPGTEGAGVADPLFGRTPYTGQLPLTWPRSAAQEPINVGDASYSPLFPFGWGLTTRGAGGQGAQAAPASAPARTTAASLALARQTASGSSQRGGAVQSGRIVDWLRQYVQRQVLDDSTGVPARASDRIARADVAHLRGDDVTAVRLLLQALR